jgi:succinoglycan biosynthesis transport protein ExoP
MSDQHFLEEMRQYLTMLHRRRGLILTCLVVSVLTAALYNSTARPLYLATAQLLIEPVRPAVLPGRELATVDPMGADFYHTQYELLRGRALLERVISRQGLDHTGELLTGPLRSPWERLQRFFGRKAPALDAKGIPLSPAVEAFRSRLTIEPVPSSRLVNLRFAAYDPELSARAVNALAQAFIEQQLEFRFTASAEAEGWLSERVGEQQEKLREAEKALQSYREKEGLVAVDETQALLDQKLESLTGALMQARTDRIAKEALLTRMRSLPASELTTFPKVAENPVVQLLRTKVAELREEEARLGDTLGERHPDLLALRARLARLEEQLMSEVRSIARTVENDYATARQQETALAVELQSAQRAALQTNRKGMELGSLRRGVEQGQQLLRELEARTQETGLETQLKSTNLRIVEKATVPREPFLPRKARNYQIALLLGLALGVGLTIFFERMDNTVKTPDDVTQQLGLPFLGMVPTANLGRLADDDLGEADLPVVLREPQSAAAEAYRVIRTNLIFSAPGKSGRLILFGSANPGEGKTTSVANLAASLAQNGARVLAVDADLRRPTLHRHFGHGHTPGLSDAVVGRARIADVVRPTSVSGLSVLPCGYVPPNPAELLGSDAFRDLLHSLRKKYDWVLVDAPPILAIADTPVLCPFVDGLVLVVWSESSSRPALRRALDQVERVGGKLTGVVLNKVDLQRNSYYYGQYYGEYYRKYYSEGPAACIPPTQPS